MLDFRAGELLYVTGLGEDPATVFPCMYLGGDRGNVVVVELQNRYQVGVPLANVYKSQEDARASVGA